MALFSVGGNVPKVKIEAFELVDFSGTAKDKITLPLVTSEGGIEQKYTIDWGGEGGTAVGESAPIRQFTKYGSFSGDKLVINTIVDATGVYRVKKEDGDGLDKIKFDKPNIQEYLTLLKNTVYGYNEETHKPPYIKLTWGKIFADSGTGPEGTAGAISGVYKGVLEEMSIKYELFSSEGFPVRARVELTFLPITDPRKRPEGKSPDLTHIIEIKPGDNLPKLCKQIYDNAEYYHQVAQLNGLASAYAIKPGMKVLFPPLDKNTR